LEISARNAPPAPVCLAPAAQGRQVDVYDVEPVVQIVAKLPAGQERLQVVIGGGNNAYIDRDGLGTGRG
jgi:hypothetical protein